MIEEGKMALTIAMLLKDKCHSCDKAKRECHFFHAFHVPDTDSEECIACIKAHHGASYDK